MNVAGLKGQERRTATERSKVSVSKVSPKCQPSIWQECWLGGKWGGVWKTRISNSRQCHCFSSALIWICWKWSRGAIVFIRRHWWIEQAGVIVFCRYIVSKASSRLNFIIYAVVTDSIVCSCYYNFGQKNCFNYYNKLSSIHFS